MEFKAYNSQENRKERHLRFVVIEQEYNETFDSISFSSYNREKRERDANVTVIYLKCIYYW